MTTGRTPTRHRPKRPTPGHRTGRLALVAVLAATLVVTAHGSPGGAEGNDAPGRPIAYRSLATGGSHACAIIHSGTVKCWGRNANGELGLGDTNNRGDVAGEMGTNLPTVALGTGRSATALAAGSLQTCALLDNATVKCWGQNDNGQLGLGDTNDRGDAAGEMGNSLPAIALGTGRTATAISSGADHTCALLDNATVKCWGDNDNGQLGLGDTNDRGDAAGEMGDTLPAVSLGTGRTATAIAAGADHTCAVLDNATVKCWGDNVVGQLGLGDTNDRGDAANEMGNTLPAVSLGTGRTATAISTTENHTCVVLDNATIKCWGAGSFGRLGLGDSNNRGDAAGEMGDTLPPVSLGTGRTATAVSAGGTHTCAVLDNATIKCWGNANSGRLGSGESTNNRGDAPGEMGDSLPVVNVGTGRTVRAVSVDANTCAQLDLGTIKCWANNQNGQNGQGDTSSRGDNPGEMGDSLPTVDLGPSRTARSVTAGTSHTCALLDTAAVRCWGLNTSGQLGLGDTASRGDSETEMGDNLPTVNLGTGRTAVALAAGTNHTCVILDTGSVKCWGGNGAGQLGLGDIANRGDAAGEMGDALPTVLLGTGRTATAIVAGNAFTCALLDNATVKCWGDNDAGRLGLGDTIDRGDGLGEMGNTLPAVNVGTGRTVVALQSGSAHVCVRLDNGATKCWGNNFSGQLGLGDAANRGDAAGEMGDALPVVDLGTGRTAAAITAGATFNCARLDNATVKCWGFNSAGRLGLGDTANRGDAADEMGDTLPTVSLGTGRTAVQVESADLHTCALLDNNKVKCWGSNTSAQLGLGDTTSRGDAPGEMGDALPVTPLGSGRRATNLTGGAAHSCARLDNGTVKCWGNGVDGRLGLGDTGARGDGPGEMGDVLLPVDLGAGVAATGISGTVTDAVSAAPVAGAFVLLMRTDDFSVVTGTTALAGGTFTANVAPGSYFAYLIDPTGLHTANFAGPPTNFTVPADTVLAAGTVTMAPTRGGVAGTVTETGSGTPISGAWTLAMNGNTAAPERVLVGDGSGQYTAGGLVPGNHFLAMIDPAGAHQTRFFPNGADFSGATPVAVTAGSTAAANAALPVQTGTGTGAPLTGTITETGTGTPLPSVFVIALHGADFRLARGGVTNASGNYSLDVVPGPYRLAFIDGNGLHDMEWHDNQPQTALGNAITVTAPTVTNASLARSTGSMTGTVTDDPTFAPLPGVMVLAIGPTGINGGAVTAHDGTFAITGLPPGTYRVAFVDPRSGRTLEYWDNSPDFAGAGTLNIVAGANVNDVDGNLGFP